MSPNLMKICIWRYLHNEKNYPGHHLSADEEGCAQILERLNDEWERSTLALSEPDEEVLSVPAGGTSVHRFFKLRIETGANPGIDTFTLQEQDGTLVLTLGSEGLPAFIKGIEDIAEGKGDYSIRGDHGEPLWFWWQDSVNP